MQNPDSDLNLQAMSSNFYQGKSPGPGRGGEKDSSYKILLAFSFVDGLDSDLPTCPGTVPEGSQLKGNKTLGGRWPKPA